jgi:hypothetical protein
MGGNRMETGVFWQPLAIAGPGLMDEFAANQDMGVIKDIIDLAEDLELRAKDRADMEIIHKIQSLAFSLQSQHVDIVERDISLLQENAELKRKLAEVQSEEIRIQSMIEFRRGPRTGGNWMAFCPKCHLPAAEDIVNNAEAVFCSAGCSWSVSPRMSIHQIIKQIQA